LTVTPISLDFELLDVFETSFFEVSPFSVQGIPANPPSFRVFWYPIFAYLIDDLFE
ncbi:hypothetical protein GCK32_009079, partial [Trichostrongylus colubriformis]